MKLGFNLDFGSYENCKYTSQFYREATQEGLLVTFQSSLN